MRPVGTFHNTAISKACHCFRYCQECVKFKIVCGIRNSVAHHPLKCRIFNELYTSWANFRWKLPLLGGIFLIAVRYFRLHLLAFFASFAFSSFVELFQAKPQARADTHTHFTEGSTLREGNYTFANVSIESKFGGTSFFTVWYNAVCVSQVWKAHKVAAVQIVTLFSAAFVACLPILLRHLTYNEYIASIFV